MSEAETQAAILAHFQGHPRVALWRTNTGAVKIEGRYLRFGLKGQSDLQGIIAPEGRALFVEVKSATGKLRPEQEVFRRLVEKHGALWILARSLDDVVARLPAARG